MMTRRALLLLILVCVASTLGCDDGAAGTNVDATTSEDATSGDATEADGVTDATETSDATATDAQEDVPVETATLFRYDPLAGRQLDTFPDDFYTRTDETTGTGLRVTLENATWLPRIPANLRPSYDAAEDLDGFGTTATIALRFTADVDTALPSGPEASMAADASIRLVALDAEGNATRIPYETWLTDGGETIMVQPMVPLASGTRHGVVVTSALLDVAGDPVEVAPILASVLDGTTTEPLLTPLVPRYAELLTATGVAAADVVGGTVFTTQTLFTTSIAAALEVRDETYTWSGAPACQVRGSFRRCDGSFEAWDFRDEGGVVVDGTPQSQYTIPVAVYLPTNTTGPVPVVIAGHGIGGDRTQAEVLIGLVTDLGIGLVAIDAVAHGDHPDAPASGSAQDAVLQFFAINPNALSFEPLKLRDNFRQSTFDKLQLIELLVQNPDITGNGAADLDTDRLGYIGISLGALMGPELLALSARIDASILSVGGGQVVSIVSEGESFSALTGLFKPINWTEGDLDRAFPLAQTVVDGGDPANFAAHVLSDRFEAIGGEPPHLLVTMAMNDEVVPNVSTYAMVRAFGLPHVEPIIDEPGLLTGVSAPVSANWNDTATVGYFQYDRVTYSDGGALDTAKHGEMHSGREFSAQAGTFAGGYLTTGTPTIIDPYAALSTPSLP